MNDLLNEINERINRIENDHRLPEEYPEDSVDILENPPLAVIQSDLSSKLETLKWVQDELREDTDIWE